MHTKILSVLFSLFETTSQLDSSYKETFGDVLKDYSFTEMHIIDCIGKVENPNVTKIAKEMNLTKAGVSKGIKKLLLKGAIEIYRNSDNKKEIYYKLTNLGKEVFEKHLKMHEIWCISDEKFFKNFNKKDIETTFKILFEYDKEIKKRLKDVKEQ